jgi:MFS family permease
MNQRCKREIPPGGYLMQPTSSRNFYLFFTAFTLSAFGYEFIFFVMTLYVFYISHNAFNVSVFAALTLAPRLFASFYGIIIDRYPRTRVLATVSGIVGLLLFCMVQMPTLNAIYLLWVLTAVFLTCVSTTRTALMTELMGADGFVRGNSLVLTFLNVAKVGAPLIAGVASVLFDIKELFYLTGSLYLMVMVVASQIRLVRKAPIIVEKKGILTDFNAGLTYMRQNPNVRFLLTVGVLWRLFIGLQISLFVVYIKEYLGGTDAEYGLFMTAIGLGSILGSLAGPRVVRRFRNATLVFWGLLLHYACFTLLGMLHDFNIALVVVFIGYVIFYATLVGLHSLRDSATHIEMRGRVYGSVTACLTPPAIFSMLAGGYLSDILGVNYVLIGAGLLALVSFILLSWSRNLRVDYNGQQSNAAREV